MRERAREPVPSSQPPLPNRAPAGQEPAPSAATPARPQESVHSVWALDLQRLAGNRAVAAVVDQIAARTMQRVKIKQPLPAETLYNQEGEGGKAAAKKYGGDVSYDMTRNGDTGVTVTVRVQFLNQARNSVPKPANAQPGTPELGALLGSPTEIPADDPDQRRAWCQNIVKEQVKPWNGKLTLVGTETNILSKNKTKRLPVTFNSVAVFGLDEAYDSRIIVHPMSTKADAKAGNPIDAGNYYMNQGDYASDKNVIAAHEYGHLLGMDDEYSQSNEMLNAMLHSAAPKSAPSAMAALDRKTVERMVLSSLKRPLLAQLKSTIGAVSAAFKARAAPVKAKMAAAARTGIVDPSVVSELEKQLTTASESGLAPSVPRVVAFQTTKNFSNLTAAGKGVEAGFDATAMGSQIGSMYGAALSTAQGAMVDVAGIGDTRISVQGSVAKMTRTGGAQKENAAGAAESTVGSGGSGTIGLPDFTPPSGLIGKLMDLPATWATTGSAVEAGVTPGAFTTKMAGLLTSATEALAVPLPPDAVRPPKLKKGAALYSMAHSIVSSMAKEACRQLATDLVKVIVEPVLATSVKDLETTIQAEVDKVMTTSPSGVASLGPPSPAMAALVSHMKTQLEADKAAAAGGGHTPLGTGKAAPDQHVTYSVQGLMGSHGHLGIRADQFTPMVGQFNEKLKTFWEKPFTAEVK